MFQAKNSHLWNSSNRAKRDASHERVWVFHTFPTDARWQEQSPKPSHPPPHKPSEKTDPHVASLTIALFDKQARRGLQPPHVADISTRAMQLIRTDRDIRRSKNKPDRSRHSVWKRTPKLTQALAANPPCSRYLKRSRRWFEKPLLTPPTRGQGDEVPLRGVGQRPTKHKPPRNRGQRPTQTTNKPRAAPHKPPTNHPKKESIR